MATYRLSVKMIKGSERQTGGAAAAYRAAAVIDGFRIEPVLDVDGQPVCYANGNPKMQQVQHTHNYTKKGHVTGDFIMLPEGAGERFSDRQTLWHDMDGAERQWNAQRARDVQLTLPRELTHAQHVALVRAFVQDEFVSRGMVADVAFHNPPASDGKGRNPHAHVLLSMRGIEGNKVAAKKNREWNLFFTDGQDMTDERKGGFWNIEKAKKADGMKPDGYVCSYKVGLLGLRERWAAAENAALQAAGSEARVSHLSNAARGIDRQPQPKMGKAWYATNDNAQLAHARRDAVREENRASRYRGSNVSARRRSQAMTVARIITLDEELIQGFYGGQDVEPPRWQATHERLQQQEHEQEQGGS